MDNRQDTKEIITSIIEFTGSVSEALRLGMLVRDDNEALHYTSAGYGFMINIIARGVKGLAESYAAGYQQGYEDSLSDNAEPTNNNE